MWQGGGLEAGTAGVQPLTPDEKVSKDMVENTAPFSSENRVRCQWLRDNQVIHPPVQYPLPLTVSSCIALNTQKTFIRLLPLIVTLWLAVVITICNSWPIRRASFRGLAPQGLVNKVLIPRLKCYSLMLAYCSSVDKVQYFFKKEIILTYFRINSLKRFPLSRHVNLQIYKEFTYSEKSQKLRYGVPV